MKKRALFALLLFVLVNLNSLGFDTIAHVFSPTKAAPAASSSSRESREKFLSDFAEFLNQQQQYAQAHKEDFEKISTQITVLKNKLAQSKAAEKEVIAKEIAYYNQLLQLLVDRDSMVQHLKGVYTEIKQLFENLASDPHYSKIRVEERAVYSFEDLAQLNQKITEMKNRQVELKNNAQKLQGDIDRYNKSIDQLSTEIKEKSKQQKSYSTQVATHVQSLEADAISVYSRLLAERKDLAQLKLQDAESRLVLVNAQANSFKAQLEILEREYLHVKQATVILPKDIKKAELALEEKRAIADQDILKLREEKLGYVARAQGDVNKEIEELREKYGLSSSDLEAMREWSFQPKTTTQWHMLAQFLPLVTENSLAQTGKEYIQARIDLSKAEMRRDAIEVAIKKSWYRFMSRRFRSENERTHIPALNERDIHESIKDYEATKSELITQLRTITDNRDAAISNLQRFNKSLESVKALMESLKEQRKIVLKDDTYQTILKALRETEENIRQKIDFTARLIEKYQAAVTVFDDALKQVTSMLAELTTKGFWKRSEQSIEWSKIKNIVPDLSRFAQGVYVTGGVYASKHYISQFVSYMAERIQEPLYLLMLLINAILLFSIYMLLRFFCPDLYQYLHAGVAGAGLWGYFRLWMALLIKFFMTHMLSLFIFIFLHLLIVSSSIADSYIILLIELLSIPYLIYVVHQFMAFLAVENHYRKYQIINQSYEPRFQGVVSTVLYALVTLYFLRNAALTDYTLYDLSTILLALMFIVVQIGLILLIGKRQVLSLIPENTPLWRWIKEHVEKYYSLCLCAVVAIIVMSNPYVGYGRQVFYILSRFFLTLLIIPLFLWVHSRLKTVSSSLFFYYEEGESLRERFGSGRLWYGVFIIVSFTIFVVALVFALGGIWGYGLGFSDIVDFLNRELTLVKDDAGKEIAVTLFSLSQIVIFILGGIFLNYVINQFVLKRVFDPFVVGVGVQNTISAFTKYAIILLAFFIGLSNAGLEGLTTKFAIIIGGLGFALQDPIRDFFSYFIILVQRPVKIGDLIQIVGEKHEEVIGVVRHITPRSIILRRRNSVTVVVPNSQIILNPVVNWNYSRSYFAFNDILLTVSYTKDPQLVKDILLGVLHDNYMILKSPAPIVWLHDFTENGYQFLVRGYLTADKVLEQWEISSQVRLELVKKLRENGIEIASPTRIIRVNESGDLPKLPH